MPQFQERRTVHVLNVNNYFPELCALTFPTIERWAEKIGARVNYITKRRWPDWPVLTEKLQVWYDGMDSDWNILIDADILVHPDTPDMLGTFVPPTHVAAKDAYHADTHHYLDPYFIRDGRNIGISGCLVMSSRWTHDLWRPLPEEMNCEKACAQIKVPRKIVDELCISRNLARHGLKITAPVDPQKDYELFHHLCVDKGQPEQILDADKKWHAQNWK